jgi:catechol 2,3-dioxygenase-like lactoylglutathione lyase family enzyme
MSLHRLTGFTMGVPDVEATAAYYTDFGLIPIGTATPREARFATVDGGEQLRLVRRPTRRLVSLGVGAENPDDLARIASSLRRLDVAARLGADRLSTVEPVTGAEVVVAVSPRIDEARTPAPPYNAPGDLVRTDERAPAVYRQDRVRPRKLGHVVFGTVDRELTQRFFTEGLGFKVSDQLLSGRATFMRCSTDHHNVLAQQSPVNFLHHTSWEVDDVDEIGRAATHMLKEHPERHTWGLGRHSIGSNFFYYLRDPSGTFSEYYSDMDCIVDDQLWESSVIPQAARATPWGPPVPPSMISPDDLTELMAALH